MQLCKIFAVMNRKRGNRGSRDFTSFQYEFKRALAQDKRQKKKKKFKFNVLYFHNIKIEIDINVLEVRTNSIS